MTKTTKKILVQREIVKVDFRVYWTARGLLLKQLFEGKQSDRCILVQPRQYGVILASAAAMLENMSWPEGLSAAPINRVLEKG